MLKSGRGNIAVQLAAAGFVEAERHLPGADTAFGYVWFVCSLSLCDIYYDDENHFFMMTILLLLLLFILYTTTQ